MTAVFVHGVADTYRLWTGVRCRLAGFQTAALALPGFGNVRPEGFTATKESYVDWLIGELERLGDPVDLVGHDWGGILALRLASLRPDLVRTVACGNGPISSGYEWHPLAKIWQTPVEGETYMRDLDAPTYTNLMRSFAVSEAQAHETARYVDDDMKGCILDLYRSAENVGTEWEPDLVYARCPLMLYWGKHDLACPVEFAYEMAFNLPDARVVEVDCDHWVPLEKPAELAGLLTQFWRSTRSADLRRHHNP